MRPQPSRASRPLSYRARRPSRSRGLSVAWLALAAMAWLGVAHAEPAPAAKVPTPPPPIFPHSAHVSDLDCQDCHVRAHAKGQPYVPVGRRPAPRDHWKINREACADCHDDGPPAYRAPVMRRLRDVHFPHAKHLGPKAKLKCTTCHPGGRPDAATPHTPILTRDRCDACHAKRHVPIAANRCATCHGRDERRVAPPNHDRAWTVRHGLEARRMEGGPHGQACDTCHTENTCISCHQQQRPRSHTGLWRQRIHGQEAAWDRDRCKTCHETGSCQSCHSRTEPLNHRGAWRATHGLVAQTRDAASCTACHQPSWCAACHMGQAK